MMRRGTLPRRMGAGAVGLALLLALAACDDGGTRPSPPGIGGLVTGPTGLPVDDALAYLAFPPPHFGLPANPVVIDSTRSGPNGIYGFADVELGRYMVYAAQRGPGGAFATVSAFSEPLDITEDIRSDRGDLRLADVRHAGSTTGAVEYFDGETTTPAPGAEVTLHHYQGRDAVAGASTISDDAGKYAFGAVRTGNVIVAAEWQVETAAPFPMTLFGEAEVVFHDGLGAVALPVIQLHDIMVDKPALYLYPEATTDFRVDLALAPGVRVTASEPEYGDGWRVRVAPDGRIDDRWNYLFYELGMPGWPGVPVAWCLDGGRLESELTGLVTGLGLNANETGHFLEYWLERLPPSPWFAVQLLVDGDLDQLAALDIEPAPDSVRRFWLYFSPLKEPVAASAPVVAPFERRGTVVVEWGGAVRP